MILHPIHTDILAECGIPKEMNNPLEYEPHPLCIAVCKELQQYLHDKTEWREEIDKGKMFGVLIVQESYSTPSTTQEHQLGYLVAYSGQIGGRSDWEDFVPAVFDYLQPEGFFKTHEKEISHLNNAIARLSHDERMKKAESIIQSLQQARSEAIARYQEKTKEAKKRRDLRRAEAEADPEHKGLTEKEKQDMTKESQFMKAELRRLKKSLQTKTTLEEEFESYQENLRQMKQLRKQLSDNLQKWLFSHFEMANASGEHKNLLEIFEDYASYDTAHKGTFGLEKVNDNAQTKKSLALKMIPPAGSGECCEPKLLQYAYTHHLKPIQMAMFWWGESPKEEIRHHLQFYPACNGKCKPILHWMLPQAKGNSKKENLQNIEWIYEDEELAVICKPSGLLAVPGKTEAPSVYSIVRKRYPDTTSPLIIHRLDMATSGLMVIAKTEFAYHRLQEQFAQHKVQKRYIAIICKDDKLTQGLATKGRIELPLMPNYLDRPRQIVNYKQGKTAITDYEILGDATVLTSHPKDSQHIPSCKYIRIALFPRTGRTHQLRVHCAHKDGLHAPILGDPLYGNEKADRLYLHAEWIHFQHPLTGEEMTFERKADF